MNGVFTVIDQATYNAHVYRGSTPKQCTCSFRKKQRKEEPDPAFLPPKTKAQTDDQSFYN